MSLHVSRALLGRRETQMGEPRSRAGPAGGGREVDKMWSQGRAVHASLVPAPVCAEERRSESTPRPRIPTPTGIGADRRPAMTQTPTGTRQLDPGGRPRHERTGDLIGGRTAFPPGHPPQLRGPSADEGTRGSGEGGRGGGRPGSAAGATQESRAREGISRAVESNPNPIQSGRPCVSLPSLFPRSFTHTLSLPHLLTDSPPTHTHSRITNAPSHTQPALHLPSQSVPTPRPHVQPTHPSLSGPHVPSCPSPDPAPCPPRRRMPDSFVETLKGRAALVRHHSKRFSISSMGSLRWSYKSE